MTLYLELGAALVIVGAVIWSHVQQQAAIDRIDDRIAHLTAGISLLTDTTEGALRDIAVEIGRLAATTEPTARPKTRAASRSRINGAVRRGRTIQDIAASEQLSEGEVRLQLHLDNARKERHASLR